MNHQITQLTMIAIFLIVFTSIQYRTGNGMVEEACRPLSRVNTNTNTEVKKYCYCILHQLSRLVRDKTNICEKGREQGYIDNRSSSKLWLFEPGLLGRISVLQGQSIGSMSKIKKRKVKNNTLFQSVYVF